MNRVRWIVMMLFAGNVLPLAAARAAADAQDQSQIGKGNADAQALGNRSPVVQSALRYLVQTSRQIDDAKLRKETLDILQNPRSCLRHRAGLDQNAKNEILATLVREGLLVEINPSTFPGGAMAGVFPPVYDEGSACPYPPQSFSAAPGGGGAGHAEHHAYPGGLAIHEAFVQLAAVALGQGYQRTYLTDNKDGLPVMAASMARSPRGATRLVRDDVLRAAPVWHDWSKIFVTQWHADGSIFRELVFGGNGKTDAWGASGDSRDRSHHILGLSEAMSRNLAPDVIVTIASAHGVPTPESEFRTVNFIRTAAIVARVDPVARGYLYRDEQGRSRIASTRVAKSHDHTHARPTSSHLLAEHALHQLADGDWSFSNPAAYDADALLEKLAVEFGFDAKDRTTFNTKFRNPALCYLTSERLSIVFGNEGVAGVRRALQLLRRKKLL
jgi:hypothetical protein